jgi:hypothetical protein
MSSPVRAFYAGGADPNGDDDTEDGLSMREDVQVIGMSATMPNVAQVRWCVYVPAMYGHIFCSHEIYATVRCRLRHYTSFFITLLPLPLLRPQPRPLVAGAGASPSTAQAAPLVLMKKKKNEQKQGTKRMPKTRVHSTLCKVPARS